MFITLTRHEREKRELLGAAQRLTEALLENSEQGLFLLDAGDRVLPQTSKSLAILFGRSDFANLTFEQLLAPLVSAKTLTAVRSHTTARLRAAPAALDDGPAEAADAATVLENVEVRLSNPEGVARSAHYRFDFASIDADAAHRWLVRVTDTTLQVEMQRELEDLRNRQQTQSEVLHGVLQKGGAHFRKFLQHTEAAMKTINLVLKKSARAEAAFRSKLDETLEEVGRIRRDAAAFPLSALHGAARAFEDSLQDLRGRPALSGSDFLPLAVELDQLFGQFASIKSLSLAGTPPRDAEPLPISSSQPRSTSDRAAQHMEPPRFDASPVTPAPAAAAGTLEYTLQALTGHIAQELGKEVLLDIKGLDVLPAGYQAAVKNVTIQLIRNAVMHGIEVPASREAAGKALHGTLRLEFRQREDQRYELTFEDDGRGLDPDAVRATAVLRQVVTREAAARMRDREAIKLIFKSRFTTLDTLPDDTTHGAGMSLVRRYVQEAGGSIALASLAGHETRFKIVLPPLSDAQPGASSAALAPAADEARVA